MLDHVSFSVDFFEESLRFYDATLSILGIERLMTFETEDHHVAGYGSDGKPFFWIGKGVMPDETTEGEENVIGKPMSFHVAFAAPSKEAIHEWHAKCLELGGANNGDPGPRPEYHPGYYAGFIKDPTGWRIEAVLHTYTEGS